MSKRKPAPRGLKFSQASHRYWLPRWLRPYPPDQLPPVPRPIGVTLIYPCGAVEPARLTYDQPIEDDEYGVLHTWRIDGPYVPGMRVAYTLMPAGTQLIIGDET